MSVTTIETVSGPRREWSRYKHPQSTIRFAVLLAILAFLGYSIAFLNIDLSRLLGAFPRLAQILATRYFPPDMDYVSDAEFIHSVIRTLEMSLLGGFLGVVCSIPLAWLAARNITISRRIAYPFGRFAIMGSRSIHEIIWALLFVGAVGLGALPGILAVAMRSVGFISKITAEAIENIDPKPVEAIRAVGGNQFQVMYYGIVPQILPVIIGTVIFEWDINIRRSAIMGLVGAGGLGLVFFRQMAMFNYGGVTLVVLAVLVLIAIGEVISHYARKAVI